MTLGIENEKIRNVYSKSNKYCCDIKALINAKLDLASIETLPLQLHTVVLLSQLMSGGNNQGSE